MDNYIDTSSKETYLKKIIRLIKISSLPVQDPHHQIV